MKKVDLNCDLGESFGAYTIGMDAEVIKSITSANIACGFHASDPVTMEKTVSLAISADVALGAHPGFPDLMGFGRRNINASPDEVRAYVTYQLGALSAFAESHGKRLSHVKPHGAMYNMAGKDKALAAAICGAVRDFDKRLILLGLSGSCMMTEAEKLDLTFASEVFADRAYQADGSLVPRSCPDAMITDEDEAVERVIRMINEGRVRAVTGEDVEITANSVCVHGDSPKALAFVKKIRSAFAENNIITAPLSDVVG